MEALGTKQSDIKCDASLLYPPSDLQMYDSRGALKSYKSAQPLHPHKSMLFFLMLAALIQYAYSQQKPQALQGTLLAKSGSAFSAVAWSPDGRYFASAWNMSVLIWDSSDNTVATVCGGHTARINSVSFSGNGNYMLSSSDDGSVIIYNLRNDFTAIKILPKPLNGGGYKQIQSAAFSPDGSSVYFSRDGRNVSEFLHLIFTDEISSITYTYSGHSADIYSVHTAKTRRLMLTAAEDGKSILWNTLSHTQIRSFDVYAKSRVPAVLSPDGERFLSAKAADAITLRALDGTERLSVKEPLRPVNCAAFTEDGSHFALALQDGDIAYYNAQTGEAELTLSTERGVVRSLAFSHDGDYLVAGTQNGCLFVWSINGKPVAAPATPYSDSNIQDVILNRAQEVPEQEYNPEKKEQTPVAAKSESQTQDSAQGTNGGEQSQTAQTAKAAANNAPVAQTAVTEDAPVSRHLLSVMAGLSSQPSDYFTPSYELAADYRNFSFYPLYFGGGITLGDALPSKDYPFTYSHKGKKMNQPSMYRVSAQGIAGISYYFAQIQVLALMEAHAGLNGRILWNTQLKPIRTTNVYFGTMAGLSAGFLWHGVTGRLGVEYDSRFDLLYSGYIGYSFALGKKAK